MRSEQEVIDMAEKLVRGCVKENKHPVYGELLWHFIQGQIQVLEWVMGEVDSEKLISKEE